MIRIAGLRKQFAGRPVLDGIDETIEAGKIIALVGASGCGKSTLLRCLNGLETFDQGSVQLDDFSLNAGAHAPRELQALRSKVGMVFQEFHLFSHLSVLDNVTLAPRIVRGTPRAQAEARARELLAEVGLADRADAMPRQLSGGQKQRVAIARALAQGVKVLLLDEPTSALDPELREEVREVLRRVARDAHAGSALTLLLVTHEQELARELCDEIWTLSAGKIASKVTPRA